MKNLTNVVNHFGINAEPHNISPFGDGLINDSYYVVAEDGKKYVLQRINHNIFQDVEGMQRNIEAVTSHLAHKLAENGESEVERKVLCFLPAENGKTFYHDGENFWRVSKYIEDSVTLSEVTPQSAFHAGSSFGKFQAMLADIDTPLIETIPDFHNMEFRLDQLKEALSNETGRLSECVDIVKEIVKREKEMTEPERLYRDGKLPKRICHCDTKVNNMLFDHDGNVLCVIDLDTVMPSFISSDYGDFLRTAACTTAEDEPDIFKIDFRMDIFEAFSRGYVNAVKSFITETEIRLLPKAVAMFPYMQAVRFLTDYLNGDTYYKTAYPGHNLVRTKAQMTLLHAIEKRMPEIESFIFNLVKS